MTGIVRWVMWNTFLALIPVAAAYAAAWVVNEKGNRPRWQRRILAVGLGLVWLAFLPNTCYLLTEWRHFLDTLDRTDLYTRWHIGRESWAMLWLLIYALFYACYSAVGILSFALAIRPMDRLALRYARRPWTWQAPFFVLVALGVYLGLVLRFNSWDLVSRPWGVAAAALEVSSRPLLAALISAFAAFLWLAYLAVDIWVDGLLLRVRGAPVANA